MLEMTFFVTGWPFFVRCICTHASVARMHLRADPMHARRYSPALSMANTAMMTDSARLPAPGAHIRVDPWNLTKLRV